MFNLFFRLFIPIQQYVVNLNTSTTQAKQY